MRVLTGGRRVYNATELTPWELRSGIWYKREDLHSAANGVNGAKYRVCRHLITQAVVEHGVDHIVSAQSVRSPQSAICATLCQELGLKCTIVVGASKLHTAVRHPAVAIAVAAGATLDCTPRLAYNNVIQPYAARLSESLGAFHLPYAISPPEQSSQAALQAFLEVGGAQVRNMPPGLNTLVIPFGSGNTTAGVLYGLSKSETYPDLVLLAGVGPDRTDWLWDRLGQVGVFQYELPFAVRHFNLHNWFASYDDMMPETLDNIVMHPTYEGKVIRWLNMAKTEWWTRRDGTTGFYIVGGPL